MCRIIYLVSDSLVSPLVAQQPHGDMETAGSCCYTSVFRGVGWQIFGQNQVSCFPLFPVYKLS